MFPGADDGPDGAAESAACASVFDAYASFTERCGNDTHAREALGADGWDDPSGKSTFQATCAALAKRPGNGRTVAFWQRCERALKEGSCQDAQSIGDTCKRATGSLSDGDACASDDECASGNCSASSKSLSRCGVCKPAPGPGDPCGESVGACPSNLLCDRGICSRPGSRKRAELCDASAVCADGLVCEYASSAGHSQCQAGSRPETKPITVIGDPCEGSSCGAGFTCLDGACALQRAEAGDRCGPHWLCPAGYACRWDGSSSAGYCARAAKEGESCGTFTPCAAFLVCSSEGKCALPVQTCKE